MTRASIIVITGARTERQAFIAHAQGINVIFFSPRSLIPEGNGIPIKNPRGSRKTVIENILISRGNEDNKLVRKGCARLLTNIKRESMSSDFGVLRSENFELSKLPVPELKRMAVSTTANEYEGFSNTRMLF